MKRVWNRALEGKTTAVVTWLDTTGDAHAWVTLDALDNDPRRLCAHVLTSIDRALPDIVDDLNAPLRWVGWVITIYTLASAVAMPIVGKLSDELGRRAVFVAGVLTFSVASARAPFSTASPVTVVASMVFPVTRASVLGPATRMPVSPPRTRLSLTAAFAAPSRMTMPTTASSTRFPLTLPVPVVALRVMPLPPANVRVLSETVAAAPSWT